ncbi:MAG: hypothetical protein ACRDV9_15135 [Acidimicrobiia bacterium]
MKVIVWGSGVVESAMIWAFGESSDTARGLARALDPDWAELHRHPHHWAVELACGGQDDVQQLIDETADDPSIYGWSLVPAPTSPPV